MSTLKILFSGAVIGGAIKIGGVVVSFCYLIVVSNAISSAEYGIFAACFSLAHIVGYFATVGQHTASLRFWPAFSEKYGNKIAWQSVKVSLNWILYGCISVFFLFFCLSILPPNITTFGENSVTYIFISVLAISIALAEYGVALFRAQGSLLTALIPKEILWKTCAALTIFFWSFDNANFIIGLSSFALLVVILPQFYYILKNLLKHRDKQNIVGVKKQMRRTTLGLWGGATIAPLSEHVTTVVVGIALGPISAGAFFAADRLARFISIALIGVGLLASPMMARNYYSGKINEVRHINLMSGLISFIVAIIGFLFYIFLGKYALSLFDVSYTAHYHTLLILAAGQIINAACGPNGALLNLAGKEKIYLYILCFWAIVAILLGYLLTHYIGMLGAALSNTFVVVGWNMTALYACSCYLKINIAKDCISSVIRCKNEN